MVRYSRGAGLSPPLPPALKAGALGNAVVPVPFCKNQFRARVTAAW